jgi:hypothetical protein
MLRPSARQFEGARERTQPFPNRRGQLLGCAGGTRAQRHRTAGDGEQVLDAVTHFAYEQLLLFLRPLAVGDVARDF